MREGASAPSGLCAPDRCKLQSHGSEGGDDGREARAALATAATAAVSHAKTAVEMVQAMHMLWPSLTCGEAAT